MALSNKDFIGETLGVELTERLEGTLAATALAAAAGARIFRVHEVAATRRVVDMVAAIVGTRTSRTDGAGAGMTIASVANTVPIIDMAKRANLGIRAAHHYWAEANTWDHPSWTRRRTRGSEGGAARSRWCCRR